MAGQSSADKELDDMTECSICTEVFTDPRVLPCIHTFCLKCLEHYGKDRPPRGRMPCPLCRKKFTIPLAGLSAMQKNFYMEKLLCLRKLSAGQEAPDTPDALRRLVISDTEKVTNVLAITEEVLQRLETEKFAIIKHLAGIDEKINTAADKSIAAIRRDKMKLLSEVALIRLKHTNRLDTVKQEVEQHKTELESFKSQSDTLLSSGTDDVTRSANALHDKADELMKFDVIDHVDSSLPPMNVTFTSSALLDRKHENLVGTVTEGGQLSQICSVRKDENFMVTFHRRRHCAVQ